jgi:hypothetical protein
MRAIAVDAATPFRWFLRNLPTGVLEDFLHFVSELPPDELLSLCHDIFIPANVAVDDAADYVIGFRVALPVAYYKWAAARSASDRNRQNLTHSMPPA